jgi:hypothetical protein
MPDIPATLSIDDQDRVQYEEKLKREPVFNSRDNKDVFLVAMSFGFKNKVRVPLRKKFGFVRTSYLQIEDDALMDVVAYGDTGDPEVLADRGRVYQIAEEYAHGGIGLLVDWIAAQPHHSTEKALELELVQTCGNLHKRKELETNPIG